MWEAGWSGRKFRNLGVLLTSGGTWGVLAWRFDSRTKLKYLILYWFNAVKTRRAGLKVVVWILVGIEDHLVMFSLCL